MSYRIALLTLCLLAAQATAADTYQLDPGHTFPRWQVSHFGFSTHHGQFNKTIGTLTLDPKAGKGSLDVTVDANSISTGDSELEKHLRTADFFNVENFPSLTFKSKSMKFEGVKPVSVSGDFTMLGVTKPITFRITKVKCGMHPASKKESCGAEVSGVLKRSAFGMAYAAPALGDDILLTIQVEASKD